MKNTQSLPAPADIPTPPDVITWQLNNAAKLGAAATGFARQIQQHDARIAELRAESDQVKADAEKKLTELANTVANLVESRDQLAGKRAKELGERDVALRMVALWWQETHGPDAPLPPIPDEAPADATGPFPAVSPDGATQVTPAVEPQPQAAKEWMDGTPYVFDGLSYDLRQCLVDRTGTVWGLLGYRLAPGPAPLMAAEAGYWQDAGPNAATRTGPEMPLPELATERGPLRYEDGSAPQPAEVSDQVTATPAQAEAAE